MPVLSLSLQQVIGNRSLIIIDWLGYESPDQPADGRALVFPAFGYRWSLDLDRDWIWDTRWFWIVVGFGLSSSFVLVYHLTDFTLQLWFLFTTLTFTTRFAIIIR